MAKDISAWLYQKLTLPDRHMWTQVSTGTSLNRVETSQGTLSMTRKPNPRKSFKCFRSLAQPAWNSENPLVKLSGKVRWIKLVTRVGLFRKEGLVTSPGKT